MSKTAAATHDRASASEDAPPRGFKLRYWAAAGRQRLAAWLVMPETVNPELAPLVAVHGVGRGAQVFANGLANEAARQGRVVVAPLFQESDWPCLQRVAGKGRADLALLSLMADLRAACIIDSERFRLAGFSGGAQFAHRFAMLYPQLLTRLVAASAGWYTFPDKTPFPYGLREHDDRPGQWGAFIARHIDAFLRLPIDVCVGSMDNRPDRNTHSNDTVNEQQGEDRTMRAVRWSIALENAARARGIMPKIALHILDGCGHSLRKCLASGGLARIALNPFPSPTGVC